jgi:hypothetical protein
MFYKASDKELLEIRKKIFIERGIPALTKNGFSKSPFSTAWFGKDDLGGYTYELCRLTGKKHLETLLVFVIKRENSLKLYLNIFELQPELESLSQLQGVDGLQFSLPPNSTTRMKLRSVQDVKGPPILSYDYWTKQYKISTYYTKGGLTEEANKLGKLIETDLTNIDHFVRRWHELHRPFVTSWEGVALKS